MAIPEKLQEELNGVVAHFNETNTASIKCIWIVGPSGAGKTHLADLAGTSVLQNAFHLKARPARILPKDIKSPDDLQRQMRSSKVLILDECETLLRPGFETLLSLLMEEVDRKDPLGDHLYILVGYSTTPQDFQDADPGWRTRIGFVFPAPVPTMDVLCQAFCTDLVATYNADDNNDKPKFQLNFKPSKLATDPDFRRLASQFLFRTAKIYNHRFHAHRNVQSNILSWHGCRDAVREIVENLGERLR